MLAALPLIHDRLTGRADFRRERRLTSLKDVQQLLGQDFLDNSKVLARPAGLEPATTGLEGRCSIQLSYGRTRMELSV